MVFGILSSITAQLSSSENQIFGLQHHGVDKYAILQ